MDSGQNVRKWTHFLSSIKDDKPSSPEEVLPTNIVTIKNKTNTKCLANTFANKLLQKKGGMVKLKGRHEILNTYQHLAVSELPCSSSKIDYQRKDLPFQTEDFSVDKSCSVNKKMSSKPHSYSELSLSESSREQRKNISPKIQSKRTETILQKSVNQKSISSHREIHVKPNMNDVDLSSLECLNDTSKAEETDACLVNKDLYERSHTKEIRSLKSSNDKSESLTPEIRHPRKDTSFKTRVSYLEPFPTHEDVCAKPVACLSSSEPSDYKKSLSPKTVLPKNRTSFESEVINVDKSHSFHRKSLVRPYVGSLKSSQDRNDSLPKTKEIDVDEIGWPDNEMSVKKLSHKKLNSSGSTNDTSESLVSDMRHQRKKHSYKTEVTNIDSSKSMGKYSSQSYEDTQGPTQKKIAKIKKESNVGTKLISHEKSDKLVYEPSSLNIMDNVKSAATKHRQAKHKIMSLRVRANDISKFIDDVEIERTRDQNQVFYSSINKSDIDKSCSQWTIADIAEYINFNDCVRKLHFPETRALASFSINYFVSVQKDIINRLKIVSGADLTEVKSKETDVTIKLKSIACTETGSRLILDSLLVPLCSELGLRIEVDKNINCNFLPNCRFDYCILKGEQIIGCVEAKSVNRFNDKSVAQAILQLVILQTKIISEKSDTVDVDYFPLFAIVSDGHRYIFIQLVGESLRFQHDGDKVKVQKILKVEDFKMILQCISFLAGKKHKDHSDGNKT